MTHHQDDVRVVLVEPKYPGNLGSVGRACANFGVNDLVTVNGPALTVETRQMALHAFDLVEKAPNHRSLADALTDVDLSIAFTALPAGKPQDHTRAALGLAEAAQRSRLVTGRTALVFGREDYGLYKDEIAACDIVCTIPVDRGYASMNLSHAVAVALYEFMTRTRYRPYRPKGASAEDVERLLATVAHLASRVDIPEHKVRPLAVTLRRLLGRARMTTWEYHRVMGLLSETLKRLDAWPVPDERFTDRVDLSEAPEATSATGPEGRPASR